MKNKIIPELTKEQLREFWGKVKKDGPNRCWQWMGATTHKDRPYGKFYVNHQGFRVNRLIYYLSFGHIPRDKFICHRCDNPNCCNPGHLFIASPKENTQDAVRKRRMAFGERAGATKLSEGEVKAMRILYRSGYQSGHLAKMFGVCKSTALRAIKGLSWGHIKEIEVQE